MIKLKRGRPTVLAMKIGHYVTLVLQLPNTRNLVLFAT